jgi:hypothetical protein
MPPTTTGSHNARKRTVPTDNDSVDTHPKKKSKKSKTTTQPKKKGRAIPSKSAATLRAIDENEADIDKDEADIEVLDDEPTVIVVDDDEDMSESESSDETELSNHSFHF